MRVVVVPEALRRCQAVLVLVARSTGSGIHLLPKRGYQPKVRARVSFTMRVLQLRGAALSAGCGGLVTLQVPR